MKTRIRTAAVALLVGLAAPVVGYGGITPVEPPPGSGGGTVETCTDEVMDAEAALLEEITIECNQDTGAEDYYCRVLDVPQMLTNLEMEIYNECNADPELPNFYCRVFDVQKSIKDTKALCASDWEACGIDIQDEINKALQDQEKQFTEACNADPNGDNFNCPVLDVQKLIADTEEATRQDCYTNPENCDITISSILQSAKFGETEPNDHIVSADILSDGLPIVGQMYSPSDEDWYMVRTVEDNTIIRIWFKETVNVWHVALLDSAGNRLSSADTSGDEKLEFNFDTTVTRKGKYYVVVSSVTDDNDSLYQMAAFLRTTGNPNVEPSFNFHDVETEPNNAFTDSDPVASRAVAHSDRIASNVVTYGQLVDGNDFDVYRLDSAGNEILHVDLCYENTTCNGEKAWALFVVADTVYGTEAPCDAGAKLPSGGWRVTDCMLKNSLTINWPDKSVSAKYEADPTCTPVSCPTNPDGTQVDPNCEPTTCAPIKVDVPGTSPLTDDHIYYLFEYGQFDGALIGKIDPTWGDETGIDLALVEPGTYYVIVTPILQRSDGSIVVVKEVIPYEEDDVRTGIVFPYNEDQYTFRVTQTLLDPSVADNPLDQMRATLNTSTGKLSIPEVKYAGDIYKMDLRLSNQGGRTFVLEKVTPVSNPAELP